MAITYGTRIGLPKWGAVTDNPSRVGFNDAFEAIENKVALDSQGTKAARPTAGVIGRYYYATDSGVVYRDTGTAWVVVGSKVDSAVTLTNDAAASVALTVNGATGQTANLLNLRQDSSTVLQVTGAGTIGAKGAGSFGNVAAFSNTALSVTSVAASGNVAVIRAAASQTGDLLQIQSDTGAVLARVTSVGFGSFGGSTGAQLGAVSSTSSTVTMILRGASGQTARLLDLQNNATTSVASVTASGQFVSSGGFDSAPTSTTATGYKAKALASHTASMFEAQNSDNVVTFSVDANGAIYSTGGAAFNRSQSSTAVVAIRAKGASSRPLQLQGVSGQSANLLELQDVSGNNLAHITKDGAYISPDGSEYSRHTHGHEAEHAELNFGTSTTSLSTSEKTICSASFTPSKSGTVLVTAYWPGFICSASSIGTARVKRGAAQIQLCRTGIHPGSSSSLHGGTIIARSSVSAGINYTFSLTFELSSGTGTMATTSDEYPLITVQYV